MLRTTPWISTLLMVLACSDDSGRDPSGDGGDPRSTSDSGDIAKGGESGNGPCGDEGLIRDENEPCLDGCLVVPDVEGCYRECFAALGEHCADCFAAEVYCAFAECEPCGSGNDAACDECRDATCRDAFEACLAS